MTKELKILHLEDSAHDAEMVKRVLQHGNIKCTRLVVDGKNAFVKSLKEFAPDIILSDHTLPTLDSFEALKIIKEMGIRVPFILVTGTLSEEVAVELMKLGVWDYLLKDRLQRLPAAILSALEKYNLKKDEQAYIDKVIASEALFIEAETVAHFGIWSVDLETNHTIWSAETFRILGYEPGEIDPSADTFYETIHEDDLQSVKTIIHDAMGDECSRTMNFRIKNKSNQPKYVRSTFRVKRDTTGKPKNITGFNYDVTEERMTENAILESEERYRLVVENPLLGVIWASFEGEILYANKTFCNMLGYTSDEICKMHFTEITNPDDLKWELPLYHKICSGEIDSYRVEKRYITGKGKSIWTELNVNRVKNQAGKEYFIGIILNITARKEAEIEIETLNESLEQKVINRTTLLEEANKDLEAFSFTVSHDLRTPIRAIQIFNALLQKEFKDRPETKVYEYLGNIQNCTIEMNDLIHDLLEFSKLGRTELVKNPVDMVLMAQGIANNLISLEGDKKIEMDIDIGPLCLVNVDKRILKSVWHNLLSNAIKYSKKDGVCKIQVSCKNEGNMVIFSVKDNGVGFDMKHYNKLFKPFSRLHLASQYKGTGAGLAICERIIKKHGGRIWAESVLNEGSTFYFSLPVDSCV